MKTFINRTAFSMVVAALAVTGCTKAKTNRMAELKARAVAAAPVVSIVAPVEAAPVEPTPLLPRSRRNACAMRVSRPGNNWCRT